MFALALFLRKQLTAVLEVCCRCASKSETLSEAQAVTHIKGSAVKPGATTEVGTDTTRNRMSLFHGWHFCISTRKKSIAFKSCAGGSRGRGTSLCKALGQAPQDLAPAVLSQRGTPMYCKGRGFWAVDALSSHPRLLHSFAQPLCPWRGDGAGVREESSCPLFCLLMPAPICSSWKISTVLWELCCSLTEMKWGSQYSFWRGKKRDKMSTSYHQQHNWY